MRTTTKVAVRALDYIYAVMAEADSITDWCVKHNISYRRLNRNVEAIADYMDAHGMNDPSEIDAETFRDMLLATE